MKKLTNLLIIIFAVVFDMGLLVASYTYYDSLPKGAVVDDNLVAVVLCLIQVLVYGLIYFKVYRPSERKFLSLGLRDLVFITLGLAGVTAVWVFGAENLLGGISAIKSSVDEFAQTSLNEGRYSVITDILNVAIIGPIMEELYFRGLVYNALKKMGLPIILSMLISGLAFGLWHGILVQGVYAAFAGFVFALVYEATGDIKSSIFVHVLGNSLASLGMVDPRLDIIYQVVCLIFIPYLFIRIRDLIRRLRDEENF